MILEEGQKVKVLATDDQFREINLLHKVTNGAVGTVMGDCNDGSKAPWRVRFNDDWWDFSADMLQLVDEDTPITDCKIQSFKVQDTVKVINVHADLSKHVSIGSVGKIIYVGSEINEGSHHVKVRFNNDWWWLAPSELELQQDDTELTDDKPPVDPAVIPTNSEPLEVGDRVMFVGNEGDLEDVDISDYDEVKFGAVGTVADHADYFGGTVKVNFDNCGWWLKPDKLIKVSTQMPVTRSRWGGFVEEPRRMLKTGDVVMFLGSRDNLSEMGIRSDLVNGAVGIVQIDNDSDSATYPMVRFNNIGFYIRSKFLHRTYRTQTNSDGTDPNITTTSRYDGIVEAYADAGVVDLKTAQTHSAYADVTLSTFTPTNEVFTMLTLKTIYTLNGNNIEDLSVELINSHIQCEEAQIEAMKKGKAKTKAYQREIAKREANLAEIIAFFDSRDDGGALATE